MRELKAPMSGRKVETCVFQIPFETNNHHVSETQSYGFNNNGYFNHVWVHVRYMYLLVPNLLRSGTDKLALFPQPIFIHIHQLFMVRYTCFELDTANIYWRMCIHVCLVHTCSDLIVYDTNLVLTLLTCWSCMIIALPRQAYGQSTH